MSNVFITQALPHFNFEGLEKFGELVEVFPTAMPFSGDTPGQYLVAIVINSLRNAKPGDYFVMTSPHPLFFALTFAEYDRCVGGAFKLLRYDKKTQAYWLDKINLNEGVEYEL